MPTFGSGESATPPFTSKKNRSLNSRPASRLSPAFVSDLESLSYPVRSRDRPEIEGGAAAVLQGILSIASMLAAISVTSSPTPTSRLGLR